jgi:hypothetical protein
MEGDFVMSMSESEIKVRGREAMIFTYGYEGELADNVRKGDYDDCPMVHAIAQVLRDYHRPLSEIVQVNPDLALAREVCAEAYEKIGYHLGAMDYREGGHGEEDMEMSIALAMAKRIRAEMAK